MPDTADLYQLLQLMGHSLLSWTQLAHPGLSFSPYLVIIYRTK